MHQLANKKLITARQQYTSKVSLKVSSLNTFSFTYKPTGTNTLTAKRSKPGKGPHHDTGDWSLASDRTHHDTGDWSPASNRTHHDTGDWSPASDRTHHDTGDWSPASDRTHHDTGDWSPASDRRPAPSDSMQSTQYLRWTKWCWDRITVSASLHQNTTFTDLSQTLYNLSNRCCHSVTHFSRNWGNCLSGIKARIRPTVKLAAISDLRSSAMFCSVSLLPTTNLLCLTSQ